MDELILRQAAIDNLISFLQLDEEYAWGTRECLNALPTADVVEVKHGEWIIDENDPERDTQCSICGFVLDDWIQGALYSFCPNCGADMRKETEDA